MLSKKLERLAAEERRQQRLRRRAQRKAAAASAAAAAAGAPPPAAQVVVGPEAGARLGAAPQREEGPAAVQLREGQAQAPLGFGAALKRLLSNPEVGCLWRQAQARQDGRLRRLGGCTSSADCTSIHPACPPVLHLTHPPHCTPPTHVLQVAAFFALTAILGFGHGIIGGRPAAGGCLCSVARRLAM